MPIWISWNIDIRRSLNTRDSFPGRKFENRAPTSCSPGPILWPPTISFELHAKPAEEIDLEMCSYGQLSELHMLRDLGSDQGHINVHSTSSTISTPNHVTVAWRSTEMWPFEFREIWTRRSLNSCDSFPRRKFNQKAPQGGCGHRRQHARRR